MAFIKGIKAIQELKAKAEAEKAERSDRQKTDFFKLKSGESIKVRFLQEVDEDSPNYDPELDTALIVMEHQAPGPDGWKRRAQCTIDEGHCYPCERRAAGEAKDWKRAKSIMYINVLEEPGTDKERVTVLGQSVFGNGIIQTLIEYAGDEEMGGSITDREWKIKREGENTESKHHATAYPAKEFDVKPIEYKDKMFDLTKIVPQVPYERQEAYYNSLNTARREGDAGDEKRPERKRDGDYLGW